MSSNILSVLVAIRGNWSTLYDNQEVALKNFLKRFNQRGMYTMGSSSDPEYDCMFHGRDSNGRRYNFAARLKDNVFFIQLGDGKYHELLIIHKPSKDVNAPRGKTVWERSDSFHQNVNST